MSTRRIPSEDILMKPFYQQINAMPFLKRWSPGRKAITRPWYYIRVEMFSSKQNIKTRVYSLGMVCLNYSMKMAVEYDENRINGIFKRWNPTGTLADSGEIRNNHCQGEWHGYHRNGKPAYKVNYISSNYLQPEMPSQLAISRFLSVAALTNFQIYAVPDGKYFEWYENGQLKDSCDFAKGKKTGIWKSWYADGKIESEGRYQNDSAVGVWNWFHSTGQPATREVYRGGKLADLACYDSTGTSSGFTCALMTRPHPTADSVEGSFEDYLIANLYYPKEAMTRGIEGMVSLEFVIGKDGKLKSINIISSPSDLLSEEVVRLLKSIQQWAPAISHNRPIDYVYEFNVPFMIPE